MLSTSFDDQEDAVLSASNDIFTLDSSDFIDFRELLKLYKLIFSKTKKV